MAADVAERLDALQRWTCWKCHAYLGEKAVDAQAPVIVVCWRCKKRNDLHAH